MPKTALGHVVLIEIGLWEIKNMKPQTMGRSCAPKRWAPAYGDSIDDWYPLDDGDRSRNRGRRRCPLARWKLADPDRLQPLRGAVVLSIGRSNPAALNLGAARRHR